MLDHYIEPCSQQCTYLAIFDQLTLQIRLRDCRINSINPQLFAGSPFTKSNLQIYSNDWASEDTVNPQIEFLLLY